MELAFAVTGILFFFPFNNILTDAFHPTSYISSTRSCSSRSYHIFLSIEKHCNQNKFDDNRISDRRLRRFVKYKLYSKAEKATTHDLDNEPKNVKYYQSYVEKIKCQNFVLNAASTNIDSYNKENNKNNNEVVIHLGNDGPNLVAITGETGSGKSLLVFKVFQLILGEKVSPMIMRGSSFASGEVVLKLSEPHLSFVKSLMTSVGLDASELIPIISNNYYGELSLKRTILQGGLGGRLKSQCEINGKQVTLKVLRSIAKPLITIVDATAASSALSQSKARIAIIDTGVSNVILSKVKSSRKEYREARKERERIEGDIASRIMPASFTPADGGENVELLQHWIDELDKFQSRLSIFQESIASSRSTALLLKNYSDDELDDDNTFTINENGSSFVAVLKSFTNCSWDNDVKFIGDEKTSINSSFYSQLLDLRDGVKKVDSQYASAKASCDALSSLSSSQSVASALEASRNHLFDATSGCDGDLALNKAAEQSHELMNKLEDALNKAVNFMSDHPVGLISTFEKMRENVGVSVEEIDFLIADWGSLARKHGVPPLLLPQLHNSLRQELEGNVEARLLLPQAKEKEKAALSKFVDACKDLSMARFEVCASLTKSVTARLKDLGMEGSSFTSQLNKNIYKCTDSVAYSDGATLGIDSVDFILTHRNSGQDINGSNNNQNMGNLEVIGSSGEKARLLLAIETDLPGSVGASCNFLSGGNDFSNGIDDSIMNNPGPVSVCYDEIDAHVGGNAAVSIAKLLADQTQLRDVDSEFSRRNQIVSITHSPSLAAIADRHIVVRKMISTDNDINEGKDKVLVVSVKGLPRLEEIARMASGDLAVEESIQFAEALLRDSLKYKQAKVNLSSTNKD